MKDFGLAFIRWLDGRRIPGGDYWAAHLLRGYGGEPPMFKIVEIGGEVVMVNELDNERWDRVRAKLGEPAEGAVSPIDQADQRGQYNGRREYEARVAGASWKEMGGQAAMMRAKRYAEREGLAWPVGGEE